MNVSNPLVVVPARLKSTRLPQKLLKTIHGHSIIAWVCDRLKKAAIARYVVATDSHEIKKICDDTGHECLITPDHFKNGTERVAYAANLMSSHDYYVNVQADEPLINTELIEKIVDEARQEAFNVAVSLIEKSVENNPNEVKAALGDKNRMRYASRQTIPYGRDVSADVYKIHGVYGYTNNVLEQYLKVPIGPLEQVEKVEQLRCVENDIPIFGVITSGTERSIDTQEDYEYMKTFPLSRYLREKS